MSRSTFVVEAYDSDVVTFEPPVKDRDFLTRLEAEAQVEQWKERGYSVDACERVEKSPTQVEYHYFIRNGKVVAS